MSTWQLRVPDSTSHLSKSWKTFQIEFLSILVAFHLLSQSHTLGAKVPGRYTMQHAPLEGSGDLQVKGRAFTVYSSLYNISLNTYQ